VKILSHHIWKFTKKNNIFANVASFLEIHQKNIFPDIASFLEIHQNNIFPDIASFLEIHQSNIYDATLAKILFFFVNFQI
jgi:hypothetical protein